ncbi:MAG: hypothetical protein F6K31_19215 [Symploca sp. SIO2G7]|nr:hypothetical protein [Symploca sp. SIO2G7]
MKTPPPHPHSYHLPTTSPIKSVGGSFHRLAPIVGSRRILMGGGDPPYPETQTP